MMKRSGKKGDQDFLAISIYENIAEVSIAYLNNDLVPDDALDALHMQIGSFEKTYKLYSNVLCWVTALLRLPQPLLKLDYVQETVGDLKIPEAAQKNIVMMVQNHRSKSLCSRRPDFYPKMECFRWRIDITISSSFLARVLEPTLLFEVTLRNGKKKVFEVSIAKFHQIRYSVASVLKEIENLKKKKLLKT